jgi:hypothetical protein
LEDPGVDRRIILKLTFEKWNGNKDGINLAQDKNRCQGSLNIIMNLRVPFLD